MESQQQRTNTQYNQNNHSSSLKKQKNYDSEYNILRNRIKIMQRNQQKNNVKLKNDQKKLDQIMKVRTQNEQNKYKKKQFHKNKQNNLYELKKKNILMKESLQERLKEKHEETYNQNLRRYCNVKKESERNEKKIGEDREKQKMSKHERKELIAQLQNRSQENIMNYFKQKSDSLHQSRIYEKQSSAQKQKKKQKQIQDLNKMEMSLLGKCSESQVAYTELKNKLDNMLGRVKKEKHRQQDKVFSYHKDKGKVEQQ